MAFLARLSEAEHSQMPKNNAEFWLKKFSKNKKRDALVTAILQERGWRVVRIWEFELARVNWGAVARKIVNSEW